MSNNVRHTIAKWIFKQSRGFDELPPEDSTITYAKALLICASGDGEVSPAEKNWILGLTAAKGASDSDLEELKNYPATDSLEQVIASNDHISGNARHAIIYDAIGACSADGAYQEGEKAAVRKAATLIGVSEDVVQQLEELYAEEKKLFDRKIQLFYPKGHPYG